MKVKKISYVAILLVTIILTGCSASEETEVKHLSDTDKDVVKKSIPLQLTQEQKEEYYKQYKEIVAEANGRKIGIGLEVTPIEGFKPEDWVEPKEYKQKVQAHIDSFLESERKALNALPSTTTKAVMESNGETKKTVHLYVSDIIFSVEVSGKFERRYNEPRKGQVFAKVDNITSHIASSSRSEEWVQTSYDASLIDNGRTYRIQIEGIHKLSGISIEKAFSIEFSCEKTGQIT